MKLGSAKVGDKVRALSGIANDPDWYVVPEPWRPIPDVLYTVVDAVECPHCGELSFVLAEIPLVLHVSLHGSEVKEAGLKAEWFVPAGRMH